MTTDTKDEGVFDNTPIPARLESPPQAANNDDDEEEVKASNDKVAKWIDNNNDTLEKIRLETCGEFEKEYYGLVNQPSSYSHEPKATTNSVTITDTLTVASKLVQASEASITTTVTLASTSPQIPTSVMSQQIHQLTQQQIPTYRFMAPPGSSVGSTTIVPASSLQAQSDRYPVRFIQLRPPQPPQHLMYHTPAYGRVGYGAQIHHPAVASGGIPSPLTSPNGGMCSLCLLNKLPFS